MMKQSFNFEKFGKNNALFDQIVIIYQMISKQIYPIRNK